VTPNLGSETLGSFHSFYAINPKLSFTSCSLHQFWYQSFRSDCFFKQSRLRNTIASSQSLLLFCVTHPKIHCHHTTTIVHRPTSRSHHTNHGSFLAATNCPYRMHCFFCTFQRQTPNRSHLTPSGHSQCQPTAQIPSTQHPDHPATPRSHHTA
jgi:hypothetical protein